MTAAVNSESPDDILRKTALRSFGTLGDDKATPTLLQWSQRGKPIDVRAAAIFSLGRLDKKNPEITKQLVSYLGASRGFVRLATIHALGTRGDSSAVPALEALLKSDDLSIEMVPTIKQQIARLQNPHASRHKAAEATEGESVAESENEAPTGSSQAETDQRLVRLEKMMQEMNERLKAIESRRPAKSQ